MNYKEAINLLTGRCKDRRKLANNTYLERREEGKLAIRLHNTDIVILYPNGYKELNSGGFKTVTTRDRMNRYIGNKIYQQNHRWYITDVKHGVTIYYDGIKLNTRGNVINPQKDYPESLKKMEKLIESYIRKVKKMDKLPLPSNGDCWFCLGFDAVPPADDGQSWKRRSKKPEDNDHIKQHLLEKYVHGSIIVNAMRFKGYKDVGISMYLNSSMDRWGRQVVIRSLRKWFRYNLGLPY